jgi:hypothetical protein
METQRGRCVKATYAKENAMLTLIIGMGVPVFAVIAYALISPDPPDEADRS